MPDVIHAANAHKIDQPHAHTPYAVHHTAFQGPAIDTTGLGMQTQQ